MHHTALRTAPSCQADSNSKVLVLVFVFVLSSACLITGRRWAEIRLVCSEITGRTLLQQWDVLLVLD